MNFVMGLLVFLYQIIVFYLTKIVYYKPVKITIDILGLVKVIINVVVHNYDIFESILMD